MEINDVLDFIAEAGTLKKVKRSGWWMVGAANVESVADHSYRCAVVGYLLARMEGVDPLPVLMMSIFGDLPEARINDLHKVSSRYLDGRKAEKESFTDQIEKLDDEMRNELQAYRNDYDDQGSKESIVARDADILECIIQAKEYADTGSIKAVKFLNKAPDHLKTESAKRIWTDLLEWDSTDWWERISNFER